MNYIPYGKQNISQEDIDAVVQVLQSDFLTQGPQVPNFEREIADLCSVNHVVAVNSATSALHIACLALGVGKGDIVWTTPITFVASANCALYCGADIDFVDIDRDTYNMSVSALRLKLEQAARDKKLPKVVIPVHFGGQACSMKEIYGLSKQYGFSIIEDASHAIGGKYQNEFIGNCRYSDITVFSFHPVKIITTAEGGVATTNSAHLAEKMILLRSHGITRDLNIMLNKNNNPWYYEQISLGYNYRMTELQAALGLSQLKKLSVITNKRHKIADYYTSLLKNLPVVTPFSISESFSGMHLYVIKLKPEVKKNRADIFNYLRQANIGVNVHYIPVHLQPYYLNLGFKVGDFPEAEAYYNQAITLPIYPELSYQQIDYIVESLKEALL